jgi:hypothetical protein
MIKFYLLLAAITISAGAHASVLWELNNFSFNDGATATGWFRWDEAQNKATSWNIATTAGTLSAYTYLETNSKMYTTFAGDDITFYVGNRQFRIGIATADVLDTASAHLALTVHNAGQVGQNGFLECINCAPYREGRAGAFLSADVTDVPEPSSAALSILALGLLAAVRRKG